MPINRDEVRKTWNDSAEAWVDFVRSGLDYTRRGLNNPAIFELIGSIDDLVVLDLACGEGWNTRILATKGAQVVGVDFSSEMIKLAKQQEKEVRLGINYQVGDAANLRILDDTTFDLVVCFMALQDIEDYKGAISEVSRVMKPKARFIFSIPHPCFEKVTVDKQRISAGERYFEETSYRIDWNMKRLTKPFRTISFHRTLTSYFDALNQNGLWISRLVEPRLTEQNYQKFPYLQDALT